VRLVLDTSTVVAAVRSPSGASYELLANGLRGRFDWLMSVPLSLEYEDVLCRPEHLKVSGLNLAKVGRLIDTILLQATKVLLDRPFDVSVPDPNDKHTYNSALLGAADALVTHNLRHFTSLPIAFGVKLYSPAQALRVLRGEDHGPTS
jgi:predicted nucleic acid-binding protein